MPCWLRIVTPSRGDNISEIAFAWAKQNGLRSVALVGAKRGRMAELAEQSIVITDTHYGRVEDAQMTICHMLCYAFLENPGWVD